MIMKHVKAWFYAALQATARHAAGMVVRHVNAGTLIYPATLFSNLSIP